LGVVSLWISEILFDPERRVIMSNASFWDVTVPRAMSIYANVIFAVLWVGFIIVMIADRAWLDLLWEWVQALPLLPRIVVWVLILPIMVGLWIWESSWSTFGRLLGFTGIVAWTILALSSLIKAFALRTT